MGAGRSWSPFFFFAPFAFAVDGPTLQDRIKINRVDLGRKQTLRRCVSCSVRSSGGVVYRFLTGQDAPVSVLADALYQHVPASKVIDKDELPGHGRKMLNFTDSRQNAAFFAPYLERAHERNLRRRLIMLTLEKDLEAASGQLRLPSVMERVMFRTNEEKVFPVSESDQDREKRAATWLMQEFSPPLDHRISLEGLGLLRFEPDIPENWKVPEFLQSDPWNFTKDQAFRLIINLLNTLDTADPRAPLPTQPKPLPGQLVCPSRYRDRP